MMKHLIAFSLFVTAMTAVAFWPQTCEQRGGRYETLESVSGGPATKVCVPDLIEVVQAD